MLFSMADELANAGEDYMVIRFESGPAQAETSSRPCCRLIADHPETKCQQGLHG